MKNYTIALDFHQRFYPLLGDRYLASNVFIDVAGQAKPVRFAAPFKRFTTRNQELRMLAFGTLFNFQWSAKQVHVQPIVEMVQEEWFLTELQREPVDAVLLLGHIPAKDAEWRTLQRAVRQILPKTPMCVGLPLKNILFERVFKWILFRSQTYVRWTRTHSRLRTARQ